MAYMSTWLTNRKAFESLFSAAPAGIVALEAGGTVVDCNEAYSRITGHSAPETLGRRIREVDDALGAFADEGFSLAAHGQTYRRETEIVRPDGSITVVELTGIPVTDNDSVHLFVVVNDITWRREAEELNQLRKNFRLLFENNPSAVLALDLDLRITDINPAGVRMSGYPHEALIGKSADEFVPPTQRERLRAFTMQAARGETVTFPIDAYAADGRVIQYEATALPIVSNNAIVGVYGLLENITDRMRAERTVAAQREEIIDLEHDFRSLFDRNPAAIALLSTDGIILDLNEAFIRAVGRLREQIIGQNLRVFLEGADSERSWAFFRRASEGEPVQYEIATKRADGSELPLDVTLFPKYAQGLVVGVYCVMQDITERRNAQRRLEMQTQRIRDLYLLATAPEYTDAQVVTMLQTGCRLLGMESGAIVDMTGEPRVEMRFDSLELFSGDDNAVLDIAKSVMERREAVVSQSQYSRGGYGSWIASRLSVSGALHGVLVFFSHTIRAQDFEEIDRDTLALMSALIGSALERRRTRSHLRTLAYYDSLTGLPNRLLFQEKLRDALVDAKGHARNQAVLYFDLDRFKDINDTLGHAMGDRFLQVVAHRLKRCAGEENLVARMGGDEFIVLLRDCPNLDEVHELASRMLGAVEEPYRLEGYEQFITTSIGVSVYPRDGRDDQTLMKKADMAMYQVKETGGNGYFFYSESLEAPLRTRLAQEKALRRGIKQEQFVLHYQPIVDVEHDRIVGVEALVRWNDPKRGLIFPDEFIPTAEASGLIVDLGEWIIATAAEQARNWHQRVNPFRLAVNISARQFHQRNLCDRLKEILDSRGLSASALEIEITESMALSDVSYAIETVRQLKHLGARIAVDDFGTGHSSLKYLRRFDVDLIKIDRSFVAGIGVERSDETIVKAIIAMGQSLGLDVVAEGVETREQYDFLRTHGCDRVQGYFFSPPVDAAALEALLEKRGTPSQPG